MYGKPLEPSKTMFEVFLDEEDIVSVFVKDLEEPENDDVREINHPLFDIYFGNSCENLFELNPQDWIDTMEEAKGKNIKAFTTAQEAEDWLISIGMIKSEMRLELG